MSDTQWIDAWSIDEGRDRVSRLFQDRFGHAPAGVWSAPGRANLIGEHTDYNGGLVFPFALLHRTFVALTPREDSLVRVVSAQEDTAWEVDLADVAPGSLSGWGTYVVGVAWALREAGYTVHGFDAAVASCVPYGAGLSSSAALEAATAVAVDAVSGLGLAGGVDAPNDEGRRVLVDACIRAENEIAGANTGGMDQAAALRAREGHLLLLDCVTNDVTHVPFALSAAGLELLVIDTRAPHQLVDGQYAQRRATCEAAAVALGVPSLRVIADRGDTMEVIAQALSVPGALVPGVEPQVAVRRVRHVLGDIERVRRVASLLEEGRTAEVGPLLTSAHVSLRDDYEVSCPELDVAVDAACDAGALGARMVGGGFGGSAIALVPHAHVQEIADAVATAFGARGFAAPGFMVAQAGAPAW